MLYMLRAMTAPALSLPPLRGRGATMGKATKHLDLLGSLLTLTLAGQ